MKYKLFYSEGPGTTRMEVGSFDTRAGADRFIKAFSNFHAVWEIEVPAGNSPKIAAMKRELQGWYAEQQAARRAAEVS